MGTKFIQECYWQERFFRNVLGQELCCQEPFFEELYFQERFAGNVLVGTFWQERCVRGPSNIPDGENGRNVFLEIASTIILFPQLSSDHCVAWRGVAWRSVA
jgi:hypothetical protein